MIKTARKTFFKKKKRGGRWEDTLHVAEDDKGGLVLETPFD